MLHQEPQRKPTRQTRVAGLSKVAEALSELKGPCETLSCANRQRCGTGLACDTFHHFVSTGRISAKLDREPTAHIYDKVFKGEMDDE